MKKIAILNFIILAFASAAFGQTNKIVVKGKTTTVTPAKTTTVISTKTAPGEKGVRDAFDRLIEGIKQIDAEKVMSVYQSSDKILKRLAVFAKIQYAQTQNSFGQTNGNAFVAQSRDFQISVFAETQIIITVKLNLQPRASVG